MMKTKIDVGRVGNARGGSVEIEIEMEDYGKSRKRLSICGNVWNARHSDIESGGQILDHFTFSPGRVFYYGEPVVVKPPMTVTILKRIVDVWKRWHLNDMHAECEHQEKLKSSMLEKHGEGFFYASNIDGIWSEPEFSACSVCGYRYGTAWTYRELPSDVVAFVNMMSRFQFNF